MSLKEFGFVINSSCSVFLDGILLMSPYILKLLEVGSENVQVVWTGVWAAVIGSESNQEASTCQRGKN